MALVGSARTFDYRLRWCIVMPAAWFPCNAMLSDIKGRGFGTEGSQLQRTNRIARMMLIMTLASYWTAPTRIWASEKTARSAPKKDAASRRRGGRSGLMPSFKRGLHRIQTCLQPLARETKPLVGRRELVDGEGGRASLIPG